MKPRKRVPFLGAPRKGWTPVLPADKTTALAPDWAGTVHGEKRRPTSGQRLWEDNVRPAASPVVKRQKRRVPSGETAAFMTWVRREIKRLEWRMSDLESRAGLWNGFVSKAAGGFATLGTDQKARIEGVLGAQA